MSQSIYEMHTIASTGFDEQEFMHGMGGRLVEAGLTDISEELAALGAARQFLVAPLSPERLRAINSTEALVVATEAALFADRVCNVEIQESGERMVHLPSLALLGEYAWSFSEAPYHPACGEWAGRPRQFWVRAGVAHDLEELSATLSVADFGLHFEDAFRPHGVQEGLFARRVGMARQEHPEWTHEQTLLEAKSKTAFSARLASHKGGAAVDARVVDLRSGELLDIGHDYPDGGAHVALHSPLVTQAQWQNRMILGVMAERRGMTMFPFEDWHVCVGDNTAAACAPGEQLPVARYGPVRSFDTQTGEITQIYSGPELDAVFDAPA